MSDSPSATVLVIDDDVGLLRLMERALKREGFAAVPAGSGREAIDWLTRHMADLLLLDLKLQDIEGKELINHLADIGRPVPFIIITGQGDERVAVDMMKRGALDYLVKDMAFIEFLPTVVRRAIERLINERKLVETEEARQQAEQSSHESEQRFRALVTATSEVVYRMSADWTRMLHLRGQEFIADTEEPSQGWLDKYIFPEDQARVMAVIREAIRARGVFELEHRVRRVDGSAGWTLSRAVPILDATGKISEWFGMASDITARKRAEEALRASLAELERFNQLMVGRELRMVELKKEVNEWCARLGRPAAYAGQFLQEEPAPANPAPPPHSRSKRR